MRRVCGNLFNIGRDTLITKLLKEIGAIHTLSLYNLVTINPVQVAVTAIASKFGISKMTVVLILAFVL